MKRIVDFIKKYPFVIGVASVVVLILFCWAENLEFKKRQIEPFVKTEDMLRKKTIGRAKTPSDAVNYFIAAVTEDDFDMAIRVFPIVERVEKTNIEEIITRRKSFCIDSEPAYSKISGYYYVIGRSEIIGEYASHYQELLNSIPGYDEMVLQNVTYVSSTTNYEELLSETGAIEFCEMEAEVSAEGKTYRIAFLLANYTKEENWKLYSFSLREDTDSQNSQIKDAKLSKTEKQKKIKYEKTTESIMKKLAADKALLQRNHIALNANYGKSPEDVMHRFMNAINRSETDKALSLGNTGTQKRNVASISVDDWIEQWDFAKELKYFFYVVCVGEELEKPITLKKLDLTAKELITELCPVNLFYMDMMNMTDLGDNQYLIYFWYEGDYYKFKISFSEFEEGWQIKSIRDGHRLSEEEYWKEQEDL